MFSLREWLRQQFGGGNKKKTVFASEQQAYEFCRQAYRESGGVTPELQRIYEFYQKSLYDTTGAEDIEADSASSRGKVATFQVQLRGSGNRPVGEKKRSQNALEKSA